MIREGLTFDDVLLTPQYSTVTSRSQVDLSVKWGELLFVHPIIPANMQSVISGRLAREIVDSGGLAILHRFMSLQEQIRMAEDIINNIPYCQNRLAVSVGVKEEDMMSIGAFHQAGVKLVCVDVAHGDSYPCVEMVSRIKQAFPEMFVIAGNVATGCGARRLWEAGADVVKVNIGAGSLCTTRIETGNGVPQLTALMDVHNTQQELLKRDLARDPDQRRSRYPIIADGGCKNAGDLVKSLCFADMVMTGNLFAGCTETPGNVINIDGVSYKEYVGSSTHKANHIEGVAALVPCKGSYKDVLTKLLEGLRSGMSYQNAHNLMELKENPEFIKITNAGLKESHPHDVIIK